jgi:uncharacterized membrane protein
MHQSLDQHSYDEYRQARDAQWPGGAMTWALRALALAALAGAGYLASLSWHQDLGAAGCTGLPQFDCQHVVLSRWSRFLGMPVSLPAVGLYGVVVVLTFLIGPNSSWHVRRIARLVLVCLAAMAAGAALWFLGLMIFAIGKLCLFCLIVHTCGLSIGILILIHPPIHRRRYTPEWIGALRVSMGIASPGQAPVLPPPSLTVLNVLTAAGVGLAGVAALILGQLVFPTATYRIERIENLTASPAVDTANLTSAPRPEPAAAARGASALGNAPGSPGQVPVARPSTPAPTAEPTLPQPEPNPAEAIPAKDDQPASASAPVLPGKLPGLEEPSGRSRWLALLDNQVKLDVYAHPVLGDPDAPYVVVELFDYTCKHCRTQSRQMQQARERYGRRLALVLLPAPMSPLCNKHIDAVREEHQNACRYARLALAVWKTAPSKFPAFHEWLMEGSEAAPVAEAMEHARQLLGDGPWKEEMESPAVREEIRHNTEFFARSGGGAIPKLLSGKFVVSGETATTRQLLKLLEQITGAPAGAAKQAP